MNEYKELEKHAEKLSKKAEQAGVGAGASFDPGDWSGKSAHPQAQAHAARGTVHDPFLLATHNKQNPGAVREPGDSYIENYQQESLPAGTGGKKARL